VNFALGHRKRATHAFAHLALKNVLNVFTFGTGSSSSSTVRNKAFPNGKATEVFLI
jgi:hypothetical protein